MLMYQSFSHSAFFSPMLFALCFGAKRYLYRAAQTKVKAHNSLHPSNPQGWGPIVAAGAASGAGPAVNSRWRLRSKGSSAQKNVSNVCVCVCVCFCVCLCLLLHTCGWLHTIISVGESEDTEDPADRCRAPVHLHHLSGWSAMICSSSRAFTSSTDD